MLPSDVMEEEPALPALDEYDLWLAKLENLKRKEAALVERVTNLSVKVLVLVADMTFVNSTSRLSSIEEAIKYCAKCQETMDKGWLEVMQQCEAAEALLK